MTATSVNPALISAKGTLTLVSTGNSEMEATADVKSILASSMALPLIPAKNSEAQTQAAGNDFFEIRAIPGKGYGCFALRTLPRGTRILADEPLLIVPIADYLENSIHEAFKQLAPEQQSLYWTLHSGHGQNPADWPSKIHPSVSPREHKRIEQQHYARIGKGPSLISIFQVNCMEMGDGAAVFACAARFNHSCVPNACFTWNPAIGKETIHTTKCVEKGEEITLSYCDVTHDKKLRAWELKHYGFICDCPACGDESQTFAINSAQRRLKLQELNRETRYLRGPQLIAQGAKPKDFIPKLLRMAVLHQEEGDYSARVANIYLDIAVLCELSQDFKSAKAAALKAASIKKDCQGIDHPEFTAYEEVVRRLESRLA